MKSTHKSHLTLVGGFSRQSFKVVMQKKLRTMPGATHESTTSCHHNSYTFLCPVHMTAENDPKQSLVLFWLFIHKTLVTKPDENPEATLSCFQILGLNDPESLGLKAPG